MADSKAPLDTSHRIALEWFRQHQGQEISWPEPLPDGTFLVGRAKGIHKPKGWVYALSVRQTLDSEYQDRDVEFRADGSWTFLYHEEVQGAEQSLFTNDALTACQKDNIPVGVLRQTKAAPSPRYKVLGVAFVKGKEGQYFILEGIAPEMPLRIENQVSSAVASAEFEPSNVDDARKWVRASIVRRQGQGRFRADILDAYEGRCAISGFGVSEVLEAAHIVPYRGKDTNVVQNGLLLRADLHTLFDVGLLCLDPETMTVIISPSLAGSEYAALNGQKIRLPHDKKKYPSAAALREHRQWSSF